MELLPVGSDAVWRWPGITPARFHQSHPCIWNSSAGRMSWAVHVPEKVLQWTSICPKREAKTGLKDILSFPVSLQNVWMMTSGWRFPAACKDRSDCSFLWLVSKLREEWLQKPSWKLKSVLLLLLENRQYAFNMLIFKVNLIGLDVSCGFVSLLVSNWSFITRDWDRNSWGTCLLTLWSEKSSHLLENLPCDPSGTPSSEEVLYLHLPSGQRSRLHRSGSSLLVEVSLRKLPNLRTLQKADSLISWNNFPLI